MSQRRWQDSPEVHALLPRDLRRANAKREVVDEDRGRRRTSTANGRARPVGVQDGVAIQLSLDHRQPARFQNELVAVGRENRLTVEPTQGIGPFAAAEQDDLVR